MTNLETMTEQARSNYANLSQEEAQCLLRRLEQMLAGGVPQEEATWVAAQWNALSQSLKTGASAPPPSSGN